MKAKDCPVIGPRGFRGTVDLTRWPSLDQKPPTPVDVELPDSGHLFVPADALIEQKDGSFYLPARLIRRLAS
jgi:hypothetical protein